MHHWYSDPSGPRYAGSGGRVSLTQWSEPKRGCSTTFQWLPRWPIHPFVQTHHMKNTKELFFLHCFWFYDSAHTKVTKWVGQTIQCRMLRCVILWPYWLYCIYFQMISSISPPLVVDTEVLEWTGTLEKLFRVWSTWWNSCIKSRGARIDCPLYRIESPTWRGNITINKRRNASKENSMIPLYVSIFSFHKWRQVY